MGFNFVGDVDSVRERQKEFIGEVLEKRGFKDCDVSIVSVGKAGDNYMANIKRIVVNQNGETFKMIAKVAPDNPVQRQMTNVRILFVNEHVIYSELFPKFKELQQQAGVPEEEWFKHAESYGTLIEDLNELILLEDLKDDDFDLLDRFQPMTEDCAKLALKSFAILHSLSYVLKTQDPESFSDIASKVVNIFTNSPEMREVQKQFAVKQEDQILGLLEDERYRNAIQGTFRNIHKLIEDLEESEKGSRYSVIQHGDGWINNIMYRFEDDRPSQCALIDYQMSKESKPAYDVMYMLFNSTSTEHRIQNYDNYIKYYYEEFDKSLNNYGLKSSDVYPRDEFDADMKRYAKVVLSISIIVTSLVSKEVAEASKIQESMKNMTELSDAALTNAFANTTASEVLFKRKLEGIIKSFLDLGLIDE